MDRVWRRGPEDYEEERPYKVGLEVSPPIQFERMMALGEFLLASVAEIDCVVRGSIDHSRQGKAYRALGPRRSVVSGRRVLMELGGRW